MKIIDLTHSCVLNSVYSSVGEEVDSNFVQLLKLRAEDNTEFLKWMNSSLEVHEELIGLCQHWLNLSLPEEKWVW